MEVVKKHYDEAAEREWQRLANPYSQVEYKTTLHLIKKYFPREGQILDIGCGPGRYALAMLKQGYQVSLLDLSQRELAIAKDKIEEAGLKAEGYYCQSALELEGFEDNSLDALLVMGPMYHLHEEKDRLHILQEAKRIVKDKGIILIAYINTWGALKSSLYEFPESFLDKSHFERYIQGNLKFNEDESFTQTYFTTPPTALEEVEKAGLQVVTYAGAESFISGMHIELRNLASYMPEAYANYVEKACEYAELPQFRDATEHLIVIARK
ncbi:MAG: class I SAM-dependent methyltransferase [Niameybacter sp.]|uniref:class I SAM-dependent methyltransferase n=1 Tax=Niameybacter sp. TaxID=2033640 RepID=UPI002FC666E4